MKKNGHCEKNISGREKKEEGELFHIQGTQRASSFWNVKCKEKWKVKDESGKVSRGQIIRIFLTY